jgi:hypothetical protein
MESVDFLLGNVDKEGQLEDDEAYLLFCLRTDEIGPSGDPRGRGWPYCARLLFWWIRLR